MARYRVIAVEEHWASRRHIEAAAGLPVWPGDALEMELMRGAFGSSWMVDRLSDLDAHLADMDGSGTDLSVLSLNPPGVQPYDSAEAGPLAERANDEMAEIVRRWPTRFAGLGAVDPQNPKHAAAETERVMGELGLSGLMICSHTQGRYLDEPAFEPLLAAAEAHNAPIYLHPRMPSEQMIGPFKAYGMVAAVWGYQADAGTHAVRLILSGTLDRHPKLTFVLGHLGEGLPFWMQRLDNRYAFAYRAGAETLGMGKLELTPSEYLRRNFTVTTSGMDDQRALAFCLERLGEDNVMFAIDYPYEDSSAATEFLRTADLTDSQRAKISHANAERVFGIASSDA
ncbi:MAG TPA: amidohydrolase family protein [Solirubrobacteraceae bacterium]|nr:amidohydrolase family protein [Solirubrobacteraceae bacterium]